MARLKLLLLLVLAKISLVFGAHERGDDSDLDPELRGKFVDLLPTQAKLYDHLFASYKNDISSVINEKHQRTQYHFIYSVFLNQFKLIDVDEPKEQMSIAAEFLQVWNDDRLKWNETEFGNITTIYLRQDKVWTPPFVVFSASEVVEQRDSDFRTVTIWSDGVLITYIPMKISTSCRLVVDEFPFDIQICDIRVGITAFETYMYKMDLKIPNDLKDRYCMLGNSAWDVINVTTDIRTTHISDPMFDDRKVGVIAVTLKRNPSFYLYMIVLPTFIINTISIVGVFLRNTEKMDRLTVGLTHIMTMTFILGIIAEKIPKSQTVPFLGKYIIFGLCTMLVAMMASTYLKKFSGGIAKKLTLTRSAFGQKLRHFLGSPLRITCLIVFQCFNFASSTYIVYKYFVFTDKYGLDSSKQCVTNITTHIDYR